VLKKIKKQEKNCEVVLCQTKNKNKKENKTGNKKTKRREEEIQKMQKNANNKKMRTKQNGA